jgi:hypothetical protein
MPFSLYDADISDSGSAALLGSRVLYIAWDVTDLGGIGHLAGSVDDEAITGVGGVALGDNFAIGSGSAVDRWHPFIWFNTQYGLWTPSPAADGSGFLYEVATRIRWSLSVGAAAHLYVFGDS